MTSGFVWKLGYLFGYLQFQRIFRTSFASNEILHCWDVAHFWTKPISIFDSFLYQAISFRREEYEELRGLLLELPKKVQHPIMVPFGPLASFPGHLVHTNEAPRDLRDPRVPAGPGTDLAVSSILLAGYESI